MRNLFEMLAERHGNSDGYDRVCMVLLHCHIHVCTHCVIHTGMDQNLVVQDQDKNVPYSDVIPHRL